MEGSVPTEFVTGAAGTGKTYTIMQRLAADPDYGLLCATTGIAAVNLGAVTLNSVLKYFDTDSLQEAFLSGRLVGKLREIAAQYSRLVIDELSMMAAEQLDLIYTAIKMLNEQRMMEDQPAFGLVLTGDFCQLPPIKAKWAFEARCWPEFEAHTTRLDKIWRQTDGRFLDAINHIRRGDGGTGAAMLESIGVEFVRSKDMEFDGTTIISMNKGVNGYNRLKHDRLPGIPITVQSHRWGEQRSEWGMNKRSGEWGIQPQFQAKVGAYVMIKANDSPEFSYVNGDCGHVEGFSNEGGFQIRLKRNGSIVEVDSLHRRVEHKHPPEQLLAKHPGIGENELRKRYRDGGFTSGQPFWDTERSRWVTGGITYYPVDLAYASTVHKSQGLSLDRIQVDCNDHFFGSPAMAYVAISRCRTAEGLRIVGSPAMLASRVKIDPAVLRWL